MLLVGVDALRERLYESGYRGISRDGGYYGFSLALGSAEVTLLEQAAAYRSLARGGRGSALRLEPGPALANRALLNAKAAAIVTDIVSDPAARTATFGSDSALALHFAAVVKTGTSTALRDNWCIGFTPRFTAAVWTGNFAFDSMGAGVSGVSGAAPAWREIMLHLEAGHPAAVAPLPPRVIRAGVTFEPAIEPPRRELFVAGTELATVRVAPPASERPRLMSLANGSVIALDPDILMARQRLSIRAAGTTAAMRIDIDGRSNMRADRVALWVPLPGPHRFVLRGGDGASLDAVAVVVR